MFGSHLSIAGSMVNALDEGERLGMDCVQVFTKNQQQWRARALDAGMVRDWHRRVKELGWNTGGPDNRGGIVSHASYLINLASVNADLWRKSVDLMLDEIERCEQLAIPYLVHHPGSFVGSDLGTGLSRIVDAYAELIARTRGYATVLCLEGTAGAGSTIGGRLEHLAELRRSIVERTGEPGRTGFCLDTCHLHAAGYDLSTRDGAREVIARFDSLCGLSHLKVLHLNDSKGRAGSHLDRHEHIGEGTIGGFAKPHSGKGRYDPRRLRASGFAEFVAHPAMQEVPKILETPKVNDSRGRPYDLTNLHRLRLLCPASAGKSSDGGPRRFKFGSGRRL
jgi:deoxyribonuclease-4